MNGARSTETTAMTEHAEVIVVGMGPGGEDVASRLADSGLDVVGVDAELVGGECPYWGCVPSKMIIRAADLLAEAGRVNGIAGSTEVRPDWTLVAKRIRAEATDDWDDTVAVERFQRKGGRFVRGWARLDGPGRVAIGDRVFIPLQQHNRCAAAEYRSISVLIERPAMAVVRCHSAVLIEVSALLRKGDGNSTRQRHVTLIGLQR